MGRALRIGLIILFAHPFGALGQDRSAPPRETASSLQASFIDVAKRVGPAVVGVYNIQKARIRGYVRRPGGYFDMDDYLRMFELPLERRDIGSGVIIDRDGYILTNEHVVGKADEIEVMLSDGRKFKGAVIGKDERSDVAVIKIDAKDLPAATLGDSEEVRTGQWAIAIGNPFGIFEDNPVPTMTVGVVSALHRKLPGTQIGGRYYGDLIQTDAAINPGNSGGPLLNLKGEVIGINAAIISPSGAYAGIGFAIPINRAREIIEDLKKGKEIEYGWLGVAIQPISKDIAGEFGLRDTSGALIVSVMRGSPAASAGIQPGDVIRDCGGQPVKDPDALMELIGRTPAGKSLILKILRDGKEITVDVTVGKRGEKVT
jgi:Do/DeqQ family serine protease